jgi:hypothetical protein
MEIRNYNAGDAERQAEAALRAEAIKNGTLPEYEAAREARERGGTTEAPSGEKRDLRKGVPHAAYIPAASQYKLRTGDKRDVHAIAKEMMEKEEQGEVAA